MITALNHLHSAASSTVLPFDLVMSHDSIGSYYQVTFNAGGRNLIVVWDLCSSLITSKSEKYFSDLLPALDEFVKEQTIKYYDDVSAELIQNTRNGDTDVEEVIRAWEKAFREV
jgi:hypothetical protein